MKIFVTNSGELSVWASNEQGWVIDPDMARTCAARCRAAAEAGSGAALLFDDEDGKRFEVQGDAAALTRIADQLDQAAAVAESKTAVIQ